MSTTISERAISAGLPATGRAMLADITNTRVWGDGTLQYYLGNASTLTFDTEFRAAYDRTPTDYFTNGTMPDATFAYTALMQRGFRMIDSVIATDFVQVTADATARAQADIVLVTSQHSDEPGLEGFCQFPGSSTRAAGDFWSLGVFNSSLDALNAVAEQGGGSYANWTLIHEVGHGLALMHPFSGAAAVSVGAAMDNERYTVMSYTGSTAGATTYGHAVTMMALDIAALQQQYGAETYATGNSSYTLLDAAGGGLSLVQGDVQIGRAYYCIWDSAGTDRIDYGSSGNSVLINLNDATLDRSQVADDAAPAVLALMFTEYYAALSETLRTETINPDYHAGGFFSRVLTQSGGVYSGIDGGYSIANGAQIENAFGGRNNDLLIGNEQNNLLNGGKGDDVLIGSIGRDTLQGDQGCDTAAFSGARAEYDITTDEATGIVTIVHARGSQLDGTDTLLNIEHAQFSDQLFSLLDPDLMRFTPVTSNAFLAAGANVLYKNDDGSSVALDLTSIFAEGVQIGAITYTTAYVNTNGNITFGNSLSTYTPSAIGSGSGLNIIAPFWADVDTRDTTDDQGNPLVNPGVVSWDYNLARDSFVVTWNDVGYFRTHWDKQNSFQMELIDRGCGAVEIIFRYGDMAWTTGDASGGAGGVGGTVARAGFSLGDTYFELPSSGNQGSMLGLGSAAGNQGVDGVWQFIVADGQLRGIGGATNDNYVGTDGPDSYFGEAGNDVLAGGLGDDYLYGGVNNDTLRGEGGSDFLNGGDGADVLNGDIGNDTIEGGSSSADVRDVIYGGDGNDLIDAGYGNDQAFGGAGNDTIEGGFGADELNGQAGNDLLSGGALSDQISGGDGFDFINGGFGYDRLNGGLGGDRFFHLGVADHGSDWVQDYNAAQGDLLVAGIAGATRAQFQVNFSTTVGAGQAAVQEAFVIYRPTGQVLWALIDGAAQAHINLVLGAQTFDLLA